MTQNGPRQLANARPVRFYRDNEMALQRWVAKLGETTGITIVGLLRDCVDAGLPIVETRLRNAVTEAAQLGGKKSPPAV